MRLKYKRTDEEERKKKKEDLAAWVLQSEEISALTDDVIF